MLTASQQGRGAAPIDYNLHGLVGIRLVGAAPGDEAAVTRQLGPIRAPLSAAPDITIRFVDHLPISSPIRYLGLDEAGFTDDAFLVLRSKHKARAQVQIPLDQVGEHCEIVCQTGLPAVPLLVPIINCTMLAKGVLPMHASAFVYGGTGVLCTGWSKGGKTETLLAFMARGARYVGDEWVYLSPDGRRMYGIPEPIRVWDWHLREAPLYRGRIGRGERARLRAIKLLRGALRAFSPSAARRLAPVRLLQRVLPLLAHQLHVDVHPERLFGAKLGPLSGPFDRLVFLVSHESPQLLVQPIEPQEVARRMVFSLQEERINFLSNYWKFRFAFPDAANSLIDQAQEQERALLRRILADKPACAVYHPYPVKIPALFDAIEPFCNIDSRGGPPDSRRADGHVTSNASTGKGVLPCGSL